MMLGYKSSALSLVSNPMPMMPVGIVVLEASPICSWLMLAPPIWKSSLM